MPKGIKGYQPGHEQFNTGRTWFKKGFKHTKETREKMGKTRRGRKFSEAHKRALAKSKIGKRNPMFGKTGSKNPTWKGGKYIEQGYRFILSPDHPFKNNKGYVRESRLVMEKHLGRFLKPREVVHHINQNTLDNRIENLQLFKNLSEHHKHHRKLERNIA